MQTMQTQNIVVNHLPVLTWNRLRMNHAQVSNVTVPAPVSVPAVCSQGAAPQCEGLATGCGQALTDLLEQGGVAPVRLIPEADAPIRLNYTFAAGASQAARLDLVVQQGQSAVVLMDYSAPQGSDGQGAVQTRICLEEGASLHLVQVQRVGEGFTFFNDIGAACGKNAALRLTQLILSGARSYVGCAVRLEGNAADFDAGVAYALSGVQKLDMNYISSHLGRQTTSNIHAAGSLRDTSAKLFRGTIDFINGCAGSVGGELEEVLLIDDNCINQTIPLILCAEEDVEGNHGASIGKPNEETLFYLESRGIPQEAAYALLTRAKLDSVAGRIPEESYRQEILDLIKGGEADE